MVKVLKLRVIEPKRRDIISGVLVLKRLSSSQYFYFIGYLKITYQSVADRQNIITFDTYLNGQGNGNY